MKKNYFVFALQLLLVVIGLTVSVFLIVAFFLVDGVTLREDATLIFSTVISVAIVTWVFSLALATPSFSIEIDETGLKSGLFSKRIRWSEIQEVKVVGVPRIKHSNRMFFSTSGREIAIDLFVFRDQNKALEVIQGFLPWTRDLELENLPSEASRN